MYVRGEPLNWWVCKLLEEIIVDNSEANRKLDGAHLAQTVQVRARARVRVRVRVRVRC